MSRLRLWILTGFIALAGAFSMASDCDVTVEEFPGGFFVDVDEDD